MANIFISYRRSDSEGEAGRLADDLSRRFGDGSVFMDVDAIQPGRDFRQAIEESIRSCAVFIAVIGPDWLGAKDAHGRRRLADQTDYVRLEISSALKRNIPVIPVMVRGAQMPAPEDLPVELQEIAYRNAVELTHARWRSDVQVLTLALSRYIVEMTVAAESAQVSPTDPQPLKANSQNGAESASAEDTLAPEVLSEISRQLATYIGPISQIVVKRAARRCGTPEKLAAEVALEIESAEGRAAFLRAVRALTQH